MGSELSVNSWTVKWISLYHLFRLCYRTKRLGQDYCTQNLLAKNNLTESWQAWFSTFRAELGCPINLFFVMCLDMFDEVPFVWCFVRARWTYMDFMGVSFFLLCFLMWFLCLSFPMKFSWHTSQEKWRLSCALDWWITRSTSFAEDFAHSLQRKSIMF